MSVATTNEDGARFYTIPGPEGVVDLPSATTICGALPKPGLEKWKQQQIAFNLPRDTGLVARVLAATAPNHPDVRDAIRRALDADREASDVGTALHALTERADANEVVAELTPELAGVMDGYERLRGLHRFDVVESEQVVFNFAVGYAGRFDRVVDLPGVGRVVLDVKTGKGVYPEVALQLAAYANSEGVWDEQADAFRPLPDGLRTDLGVVLHLPRNGDEPKVVLVDLSDAWGAFQAAAVVHRWQVDGSRRALLGDHAPRPIPPEVEASERRAYLMRCIEEIRESDADALRALAQLWPSGMPTFKQSPTHDVDQLEAIARVIYAVAADHGLPFFSGTDPAHRPEPVAEREACLAASYRLDALPDDLRARVVSGEPSAARLHRSRCTRAVLDYIERLLDDAIHMHEARLEAAGERLPDDERQRAAVLAAVAPGGVDWHKITAANFDTIVAIAAALRGGFVVFRDEGDRLALTVADDACDRLAEVYGGKRDALDVARQAAKTLGVPSPRSLAACASSPALIARMAMGAPHTTHMEGSAA